MLALPTALIAATALLAPPVSGPSEAASAGWRFEIQNAWNRHRTGGADSQRTSASVVVTADPAGAVEVIETGRDEDASLSVAGGVNRRRVETRTWRTTWRGTATRVGETHTLTLARTAHRCATETRWNQEPPTASTCRPVPEQLVVTCTRWAMPKRVRGEGAPETVWRCRGDEGARTATGWPWLFDDAACVRGSHGPGMRRSVRSCIDPETP